MKDTKPAQQGKSEHAKGGVMPQGSTHVTGGNLCGWPGYMGCFVSLGVLTIDDSDISSI